LLPGDAHARFITDTGDIVAKGDIDLGEDERSLGEVEEVRACGDIGCCFLVLLAWP